MSNFSFNPLASEKHVLHTRLNAAVCAARLKERMADKAARNRSKQAPVANFPVDGRISDESFTISKRQRYRSSFQIEAAGRLVESDGGTNVIVALSTGLMTKLLQAVFVIAWLFLTVGVIDTIGASGWVGALFWVVITAALIGFPAVGRWMAYSESEFLLRFLKETFDAEEV